MSARSSRPRAQTLGVSKSINGTLISLSREDTYLQNKSLLYSFMKRIETGKVKLPIPMERIQHKNGCFHFTVKLDKTLKFDFSF